ncbi:hypothetical protein DFH08DRAFT_1004578 [Mycena albidolilacea]|uniref:Uncharacterized protein n=1 Tax=Mycena albidolilacea TaxID=1033008 RepID=A0AAD7F2Z2_9AGAR|nr:hypothetical protein DFH08DRAFT_1004578 [Mycena albidolilacea]
MCARKKAALSALKLYEETASAEREARMSILPVRFYPCPLNQEPPSVISTTPPILLPSAPNSLLLPTDPLAIKYPDKTLISVPATGFIGGLATDERKELRSNDAQYCAKDFSGHVVLSPLDVVLARLGSLTLVDKLTELKKVAHDKLDKKLNNAVLLNLTLESNPSSKPDEREIDGRYWLARLADVCFVPSERHCTLLARGTTQAASAGEQPLALEYIPTPSEALPAQKEHGYRKARKYDAALRPSAAAKSTILNILVNITFTKTKVPTVAFNPLIGFSANIVKYQQVITNADDLLTFQPTRLFVPTLSFHGNGAKIKLFVSIFSQEHLDFAVIPDCFNSDNFSTVSALLHLFRITSLYQLGYNPLFTYKFTSPPPGFAVGNAVPASVVLPGALRVVNLNGKPLSTLRSTPWTPDDIVSPALRCLRVSDCVSIPGAVLVLFIQRRMGRSGGGALRYCSLEFRHPMPEEDAFNAHVQPYVDGKNELFLKGYKVDREDAGASSGLDEPSEQYEIF